MDTDHRLHYPESTGQSHGAAPCFAGEDIIIASVLISLRRSPGQSRSIPGWRVQARRCSLVPAGQLSGAHSGKQNGAEEMLERDSEYHMHRRFVSSSSSLLFC